MAFEIQHPMSRSRVIQLAALMFALALFGGVAGQGTESQAEALLREHKCYLCHANHDQVAGPAFADVAARYRGNPDAAVVIATHVRQGVRGEGPWHMPPHPEISPGEAKVMAQYILSLDRQRTTTPESAPPERLQPPAELAPRS
jgi:cytochrome c